MWFVLMAGAGLGEVEDAVDSVDGRGDDATGIACPFAAGVEPFELWVLHIVAAGDAYRRRRAAFNGKNVGVLGIESVHLFVEKAEALLQASYDERRQYSV